MAADLQETPVTYEELADLELEFEDVETEISELRLSASRHQFSSLFLCAATENMSARQFLQQ